MGRLILLGVLCILNLPAQAAFDSVRQNIQELRLKSHQLDLETRRLETSYMELQSELKVIEDETQKLNKEFFDVQRASIGRTSLQRGMSLFSAKSFSEFLKQKRWTKNWMILQSEINDKRNILKKNKTDKIQTLKTVMLEQKEKRKELYKLERKILAEEKHRRAFIKDLDAELVRKHLKFKDNTTALFLKPMAAPLIQKYGSAYLKSWDLTVQNWGWIFESQKGLTDVIATADGTVQAIEEIPYFGQVVIVGHQGDFTSVYAGVHDILVQTGETVSAEKVIARSQRFYFELRHFTVPIDPTAWIRDPEVGPTPPANTATRRAAL